MDSFSLLTLMNDDGPAENAPLAVQGDPAVLVVYEGEFLAISCDNVAQVTHMSLIVRASAVASPKGIEVTTRVEAAVAQVALLVDVESMGAGGETSDGANHEDRAVGISLGHQDEADNSTLVTLAAANFGAGHDA